MKTSSMREHERGGKFAEKNRTKFRRGEKLASGWGCCRLCRTYANPPSGAKMRCKRKIGSFSCAPHIVPPPPQCIPTIQAAVLSNVPGGRRMHNAWHARVSSFVVAYFKSQLPHELKRTGNGRGWGRRPRKEAPSVQNLREFGTPSRNTLAHVVEEIAKFPTGLLRHVSIAQRGCFLPTPLSLLPVMPKILTHSLVKMSIPVSLVFFLRGRFLSTAT